MGTLDALYCLGSINSVLRLLPIECTLSAVLWRRARLM